jgi:hypothetical protein
MLFSSLLPFLSYLIFALSPLDKINFDLSTISPEGLIGPTEGLTSLAYEFCIPAQADKVKQVQALDPSVKIYPQSSGRIGCQKGQQYLCIGDTHQREWQEILTKLAHLDYIEKINRFYGE